MKKLILLVICNWACLVIFSQNLPRVIVLGFDGMGGYAFPNENTPNINAIMQEGSYTFTARSVVPSMSSPNWASMINGLTPSMHKIWGNGWKLKKVQSKYICNEKGRIAPTVFRLLREQIPSIKMDCVHDWDAFINLTEPNVFSHAINSNGEDETAQKAIELIHADTPDFLFLHFDHVDHVGHTVGHKTKAYYKAVEKADSLTGAIVNALKTKGIYDDTYILITADHGGRLMTHGGLSPAEMNIPWIIRGPKIRKGFKIADVVKQYDTAATLAKIFGISVPACWVGKPVESVFVE